VGDLVDTLVTWWPRLWDGTWITLQLSLGGAALAFVIAVALGLASMSRFGVLRFGSRVIVELFRGTSLVVQLFWFFYVMPQFGFELEAMTCGILALGLNYGAYGAEVVRGSLNAVPKGQWEVTTALSMPWVAKMRRVIWPQAWALMLPGLNNLMVMLIKGTSLALLITLHDLTFVTDEMRRSTGTFVAFGTGLVIYYLIALAFSSLLRLLERRAQRRLGLRPTKAATTQATAQAVA
jgi:polar amino acid transport system permease protein